MIAVGITIPFYLFLFLSLSLSDISVVFMTPQLLEQVPTAMTSLYAGGAGVTTGISTISGTKSSISSL